jgi:hypothetical protein
MLKPSFATVPRAMMMISTERIKSVTTADLIRFFSKAITSLSDCTSLSSSFLEFVCGIKK